MRYTAPVVRPPDVIDRVLVGLYLIGLYIGLAAPLPGGVPVPVALAGAAGLALLVKHFNRIANAHIMALGSVLVLYVLSILSAPDYVYLGERFKGFIQISYSALIAYGFFLAVMAYDRAHLSRLFLWFCLAILVGCALENYTAFVRISDAFRNAAYDFGVYIADQRDEILYGRVRPKLFTSEPAAVTFSYTLFCFAWYTLAKTRLKLLAYLALLAGGYFLMRGPTLFLGVALVPVYEILIAARRGPPGASPLDLSRVVAGLAIGVILIAAAVFAGGTLLEERLRDIASGQDASFFSRIVAPPLVALKVLALHPVAGAGLTGWEFIEGIVQQIYATAPELSINYRFQNAAQGVTNYFWLHWIFLGLFWGGIVTVAWTLFLHALGAPSLLYCWLTWAVFGQAAGAYVDPRTWTVLLLACAITVIHERERLALRDRPQPDRRPTPVVRARPRFEAGS